MLTNPFTILISLLLFSTPLFSDNKNSSEYLGQENRKIKSLSNKDIQDLESGAGWGLAKPAELNGVPGPIHVLELKRDLDLSKEQVSKIEEIWSTMNQKAIKEGKKYLIFEKRIENFFLSKNKNINELESILNQSSQHLANLRKIHLSAHLETLPILSFHQIKQYRVLRGYRKHTNHTH